MKGRIWLGIISVLLIMTLACCGKKEIFIPAEPVTAQAGMRSTVLYLQDDNGLLVPVMKRIPWVEGIGKAALSNITASAQNTQMAATLGLKPVLPEGAEFDLRINGGDAIVDIKSVRFDSAEDEGVAVTAVVNTLTEFPSIDTVRVRFDGEGDCVTELGTDLTQPLGPMDVNLETMAMYAEAEKVVLYFPNASGQLNVPVTRFLYDAPDIEMAVLELIKGPADVTALSSCFPAGTKLLGANVENGLLTVDLSEEFLHVAEFPDMEARAIETLFLTCKEFEGVETLQVTVNGKPYETQQATMAPAFVNKF